MSPTFSELGVPAPIVESLRARGIDAPFPIQAASLPDALAGRDLCGKAPTGSGKTIAFGIPMAARCHQAAPKRPTGLVLVPTRELAEQVATELRLLAAPQGRVVESFYGGVSIERQTKALRRGVDLAVACPGRLRDLLDRGDIRLDAVEVVVLDEADRMADMGFLPEVKRILDQTPSNRQTLLFSATLDGDIDVLIRRYQQDPGRVEVARDEDDDAADIDHHFWSVPRERRLDATAEILQRLESAIVFTRTRHGADRVAQQLERRGVPCAAMHGDKSQGQRERALAAFRDGRVRALVATDVAARGIHVDGVAGVVQYDTPADHKDYTHRAGRTARAGTGGVVVTLVIPDARTATQQLIRALGRDETIEAADPASLGPVVALPEPSPERSARQPGGDRSGRPDGDRPRPGGGRSGTARKRGGPRQKATSGATPPERSGGGTARVATGTGRGGSGRSRGTGGGNAAGRAGRAGTSGRKGSGPGAANAGGSGRRGPGRGRRP